MAFLFLDRSFIFSLCSLTISYKILYKNEEIQSTLNIVELQKNPLYREKLDIVEFLLNKIIFGNPKKSCY